MPLFNPLSLITLCLVAFLPLGAAAEEPPLLAPVVVSGQELILPTQQAGETVYTGSRVTAEGVALQGSAASSRVAEALGILPGLSVESADGVGLAAEQGNLRVRGVRGILGALTVEGVPNFGLNPIGPRDYLYDLENMAGLSLYKGPVPADIGTGVGSRGGAVVLHPEWPGEEFALRLKQGFGSHDYSRSYLRLDSGSLNDIDTRFSVASSYGDADKWRGPGEVGPRRNLNLGFSQPLGEKADLKLWYNRNELDQHLYRALSYADIRDLKGNYRKDFNEVRSGAAADDIYYYDDNRGVYRNDDLISILTLTTADTLKFIFKPYFSWEDSRIREGVTVQGGRVQERNRDIERGGVIAEVQGELGEIETVLGYHFENSDMDVFTRNFAITPGGLEYRGLGVMASAGDTRIHSPYLKFAGRLGAFDWQAGMKYFRFEDSDSRGYVAGPAPDYAPVRAADLDRAAEVYDIWLPTLGVAFDLNERLQLYAGYGRNFIRPYAYLPLATLYNNQRARFQGQGIDLQQLFDGYDLEKSDTVDLGLRYAGDWFDLAPTLFLSRHKNLLTSVYDPRVDLNYQQNVGEASGYGIDLEMNAYPRENLTLFVNPSYTVLTYDKDLTFAGARLDSEGRQVVDTPRLQVKSGLIYRLGAAEIAPVLRWMGARHGDVEHRERIGSCLLVDLRGSYSFRDVGPVETLKIGLELNNLLNRKYVSVINAFDDSREGQTGYYPGAPLTTVLTVDLKF
ncbi:TonB-dependent receptor [Desulfuromonas acetexigens]|jgi:iron complex outermembrane receptor protein|uniref:TonB-dependent receptor n=1 Tax=Trichloromonas acetexigens TaxID=38815 RepID=A0A550JBJ5_9BACT|nr:TonB-dependent receptor [Desulfuromonas acetexigens]TRO80630.1 TonB-dependent receptor [Desulfuromonas acetexigens]